MSDNATEANATVAERQFIERTLWPKLVRLSQKITQELLPFWPGDTAAEFEDIRPTDARARLEEIRVSYPVLSINEIRERYYRLPPVAWGDSPVNGNIAGNAPLPDANADGMGVRAAAKTHALPAQAITGSPGEAATTSELPAADPLSSGSDSTGDSARTELARWERFALKRLGRANSRPFEVRALPAEVAYEVSAGLLAASSEDEVKAVFAGVRAGMGE